MLGVSEVMEMFFCVELWKACIFSCFDSYSAVQLLEKEVWLDNSEKSPVLEGANEICQEAAGCGYHWLFISRYDTAYPIFNLHKQKVGVSGYF